MLYLANRQSSKLSWRMYRETSSLRLLRRFLYSLLTLTVLYSLSDTTYRLADDAGNRVLTSTFSLALQELRDHCSEVWCDDTSSDR